MIQVLEIKFDNEGNITQDFIDRDVPQFSHNVQAIRLFVPSEIFEEDGNVTQLVFENNDEEPMISGNCIYEGKTDVFKIYNFKLTRYYTQYLGKLNIQLSVGKIVNNEFASIWESFQFYLNVKKGVKGQDYSIDDPDIALNLQQQIDDINALLLGYGEDQSLTNKVNINSSNLDTKQTGTIYNSNGVVYLASAKDENQRILKVNPDGVKLNYGSDNVDFDILDDSKLITLNELEEILV